MTDEDEFTGRETERQDCVDDIIHNALEELAGQEIEWDIENIADIRDVIQEVLVDKLKLMTEQEFYPYRELESEPELEPEETGLKQGEEVIVTDEQIVIAMKKVAEELDANELAQLAGDALGGLCWYTEDGLYSFIPDEHYGGGLDFIKENIELSPSGN